jgi:hypothetical protein
MWDSLQNVWFDTGTMKKRPAVTSGLYTALDAGATASPVHSLVQYKHAVSVEGDEDMEPTANGSNNNWFNTADTKTANHIYVRDANQPSTYLDTSVSGAKESFVFSNITSLNKIESLTLRADVAPDPDDDMTLVFFCRTAGGTEKDIYTDNPITVPASRSSNPKEISIESRKDPQTNDDPILQTEWTVSNVNSYEFGFYVTFTTKTGQTDYSYPQVTGETETYTGDWTREPDTFGNGEALYATTESWANTENLLNYIETDTNNRRASWQMAPPLNKSFSSITSVKPEFYGAQAYGTRALKFYLSESGGGNEVAWAWAPPDNITQVTPVPFVDDYSTDDTPVEFKPGGDNKINDTTGQNWTKDPGPGASTQNWTAGNLFNNYEVIVETPNDDSKMFAYNLRERNNVGSVRNTGYGNGFFNIDVSDGATLTITNIASTDVSASYNPTVQTTQSGTVWGGSLFLNWNVTADFNFTDAENNTYTQTGATLTLRHNEWLETPYGDFGTSFYNTTVAVSVDGNRNINTAITDDVTGNTMTIQFEGIIRYSGSITSGAGQQSPSYSGPVTGRLDAGQVDSATFRFSSDDTDGWDITKLVGAWDDPGAAHIRLIAGTHAVNVTSLATLDATELQLSFEELATRNYREFDKVKLSALVSGYVRSSDPSQQGLITRLPDSIPNNLPFPTLSWVSYVWLGGLSGQVGITRNGVDFSPTRFDYRPPPQWPINSISDVADLNDDYWTLGFLLDSGSEISVYGVTRELYYTLYPPFRMYKFRLEIKGDVGPKPKVTYFHITATGKTADVRTKSKMVVSATDFQRYDDSATLTDVLSAGATAPTITYTDRWETTKFNKRQYWTNGIDGAWRYPDGSDEVEDISANAPKGFTVASYAGRLFFGNTEETGTQFPDRVRWCISGDDSDWTSPGSGFIDLDDTEGTVQKLLPLGGMLVGYKDFSIYNLQQTGDNDNLIIKQLLSPGIGIAARSTALSVVTREGLPAHIFMGQGRGGLNVYMYTGNMLLPIGDPIKEELRDQVNPRQSHRAFALLNTRLNQYLFFVAYGGDTYPSIAWVFDIDSGQWKKWTIPQITTAGFIETDERDFGHLAWTVVLGASNGFSYWFDETSYQDYTGLNVHMLAESGDWGIGNRAQFATLYRLHISHLDKAYTPSLVSVSTDGGKTYTTPEIVYLGQSDGSADDSLQVQFVDLMTTGKRFRIKIEHEENDPVEITEVVMEIEEQGWLA